MPSVNNGCRSRRATASANQRKPLVCRTPAIYVASAQANSWLTLFGHVSCEGWESWNVLAQQLRLRLPWLPRELLGSSSRITQTAQPSCSPPSRCGVSLWVVWNLWNEDAGRVCRPPSHQLQRR